MKPGGTEGGTGKFLIGLVLCLLGIYFFFDSVQFTTGHRGLITGAMFGRGGGGGLWETTSMGVLFVPLFAGLVALFFDARKRWAWGLTGIGALILAIEIVSRIRPFIATKATHFILILLMIAGGLGLMLRAYSDDRNKASSAKSGSSEGGAG